MASSGSAEASEAAPAFPDAPGETGGATSSGVPPASAEFPPPAPGRKESDGEKEEEVLAKIHATRAMWQTKLDEKMAKKEQDEYDAEAVAARRREVLSERETRKLLRHEARSSAADEDPTSLKSGRPSEAERTSTLSWRNSERNGISPEERLRRQEEEDLLVAQRLQEEEALAASAAEAALRGDGKLEEGEERPEGHQEELDRDFLLAMELQEQAQQEAQQAADLRLAGRLQREEDAAAAQAAAAARMRCSSFPMPCPGGAPVPAHFFNTVNAVPAYRTTGGGSSVSQQAGLQRVQTVSSAAAPRHTQNPAIDGENARKKKGFFARIFGRRDKSAESGKTSSSSSAPRPHFLQEGPENPPIRPDLVACCAPHAEPQVIPVAAAYRPQGPPTVVPQSLELVDVRREGEGFSGQASGQAQGGSHQRQVVQVVQTVEPERDRPGPPPRGAPVKGREKAEGAPKK